MTVPEMSKVTRVMKYFRSLQKDAGILDASNMVQNKWDMRTVIEHIDDDKRLKQLIQFYFLYSDAKTFRDFFDQYDSYYETMLNVIRDRRNRKNLLEETVGKKEGDA